jgi:pimeloyl-ACP methyl ester carboxylesterase
MKQPVCYRTVGDGLSIFYREAGPKNAPTILLLHGLPSSARMFEPLPPPSISWSFGSWDLMIRANACCFREKIDR